MSFHCIAWSESYNTAVLEDLAPVTDEIITIQNSHFVPQRDYNILWCCGLGTDLQRLRFVSPSLRQMTNSHVRPLQPTLVGANNPNIAAFLRKPLRIKALEELAVESVHDAGVAQRITAIAGIQWARIMPVPNGDVYTMRGTSITAVTANAWTTVTITWDDTLPLGTYAVVGMEYFSANAQAARLVFEDQVNRPGCVGVTDRNQRGAEIFRGGDLGVWGYFNSNRMPNVQALANAADAAADIYLDFVRVR